jgi:LacI family transcriptional regulator
MGNRFPTPGKRVTIGDVAALAGVSKGTVSKYLGGGDYYISEETRERIAAAVAELDFQPNAIARGLVRRRSQTIGVVVASITNPLYAELIAGIDEVLSGTEFTMIFGTSEGSAAKEVDVVRSMRQRQVDGIVMASVTMRDAEVEKHIASGLNVVLASRNLARTIADTVVVDNDGGARDAVLHLAEHGHTRIAHIAGPQNVIPFAQRRAAYDAVVAERGLDADPGLCVATDVSTLESGAEAAAELLALPEPPTAVFVGSDAMALGVMDACAAARVGIPEDLAVVGFDNVWVARMPGVRLTTVDSHAREIGRRAARHLVHRIEDSWATEGPTGSPPSLQTLSTTVVRRRSCGCDDEPTPARRRSPLRS